MTQVRIPAALMRGGTSKGVFFLASDLPADEELRSKVLLRAFGSPDPYRRQADGLGGGSSTTSKAAIISPSERPDCDVTYLFAQVSVDRPLVDYGGNCGNLSAAVGPFAIEAGLVRGVGDSTTVRIWQENTAKLIVARCPTVQGAPRSEGGYRIDGIAEAGARIDLTFVAPGASACAAVFPTGAPRDLLEVDGVGTIQATLIDVANPLVLVRAADLGLTGLELPAAIDGHEALLERIEGIRRAGALRMGLAVPSAQGLAFSAGVPKIALVAPPSEYWTLKGGKVQEHDIDIVARAMSMGRTHPAFPVTGAIALASAVALPGTLASAFAGMGTGSVGRRRIRLGHPSGSIEVEVDVSVQEGEWVIAQATVGRTARLLMEGSVCIPQSALLGWKGPLASGAPDRGL